MRVVALCLFMFLIPSFLSAHELSLALHAEGAVMMNVKTGAVLFSKNPDTPLFPASITKIATALYVLKKKEGHLHEKVIVKKEAIASITPEAKRQSNYRSPPYWLETDATHLGIKKGEEFQLKELLYMMLVASANDAANVVAEHVGGTIPKFMEGLNSYVAQLGCKNTHFLNPHGLHHPDQVSSARDMALIAAEAMKSPLFREMVATVRYTVPKTNLEFERTIAQTNLLLRKGRYFYPKAIGIKTGTTSAAGKTLVAGASDEGRELVAVVMGCQKTGERYDDVIKMFNAAFEEQKMRRFLLPQGPCSLTKRVIGARGSLKTALPQGLYYDFYPAEEVTVKATVKWLIPQLPLEKGECVGIVRVLDARGNVIQEHSLLAAERLNPSLFYRVHSLFGKGKMGGKILFLALLSLLSFVVFKMRKKKKSRYL